MQAYTLEITHRDDPRYLEVREGLTLHEATRTQELQERSGFTVQLITPTMRLRTWIHPTMR